MQALYTFFEFLVDAPESAEDMLEVGTQFCTAEDVFIYETLGVIFANIHTPGGFVHAAYYWSPLLEHPAHPTIQPFWDYDEQHMHPYVTTTPFVHPTKTPSRRPILAPALSVNKLQPNGL